MRLARSCRLCGLLGLKGSSVVSALLMSANAYRDGSDKDLAVQVPRAEEHDQALLVL